MSHKCGPGCRRRQTPSTRSECPSCNRTPELRARRRWAKRVIANPTDDHWRVIHTEVKDEWVERTLVTPYRSEKDRRGDRVYYGEVPEELNWLRVVVRNDRQLVTAYLDSRLRKKFGKGKQTW